MTCRRCLRETKDSIVLAVGDAAPQPVPACPECVRRVAQQLEDVRPIFDALIAGGIPSATANDVLTAYLESLSPKPV